MKQLVLVYSKKNILDVLGGCQLGECWSPKDGLSARLTCPSLRLVQLVPVKQVHSCPCKPSVSGGHISFSFFPLLLLLLLFNLNSIN